MRRWALGLSLAVMVGLVLPTGANALDFAFNVKGNKEFTINLFIFGSAQVLLDAAWVKAKADLDMVVVCDEIPLASFSTEPKFESLSFGASDDGEGLDCVVAVFSYRGNSRGNLTVRLTGSEEQVRQPVFSAAVGGQSPEAVAELVRKARSAKGRHARRQVDR
jgi:hypothetical protein